MTKKPPSKQANNAVFPITKVNALRNRAAKACRHSDNAPDGWSISSVDPMNLLGVFTALRVKPGFVLRAYQFRSGGNGNGVVWAMPTDALLPEPSECPRLTDQFLEPPKPPLALDDLMDAIEGDGTPWSYLSSSLFAREAQEVGAMWHGCHWSTHKICLLGRICGWFLLANGDFRREMRAFPLLEATVFLGAKRRGLIETM